MARTMARRRGEDVGLVLVDGNAASPPDNDDVRRGPSSPPPEKAQNERTGGMGGEYYEERVRTLSRGEREK